jgi:hypothetical protein
MIDLPIEECLATAGSMDDSAAGGTQWKRHLPGVVIVVRGQLEHKGSLSSVA